MRYGTRMLVESQCAIGATLAQIALNFARANYGLKVVQRRRMNLPHWVNPEREARGLLVEPVTGKLGRGIDLIHAPF